MKPPISRKFRRAVADIDRIVSLAADEPSTITGVKEALWPILQSDSWLPDEYANAEDGRYEQYLLYRDPASRFSIVSFAWGPGAGTPIHDHTTWGVVGVLRGAECATSYQLDERRMPFKSAPERRLERLSIDIVSPAMGDVHSVRNGFGDRTSVSLHVYGGNIGTIQRSIFRSESGRQKFVSGYSDRVPLLESPRVRG